MTALDVVVQGAALAQGHADHLALGLFGGLADRLGHLFGLALAEADTALLVAHNDKRGKAEALTTLDGLGDAVDRHEAVGEFGGLVAVAATSPAVVVTFCHMAFLCPGGAWRRRLYRSMVSRMAPGSSRAQHQGRALQGLRS